MLDNIKRLKLTKLRQSGVSIVELLVVTAVAGLLVTTAMTVMLFFYGDTLRANMQSQLAVESQNLLRNVVEELRVSSGIRENNQITDDNQPGGWTTDNDSHILIISTPVLDSNNEFVIDQNGTGGPFQNEIVYFVEGQTLYKRYLANDHPDITDNSMRTSCPEGTVTSSCPPDVTMSENFEDMNFVFYDRDDNPTTVHADAKSIELGIEMNRRSFGKDIEFDNDIRITLRNTVL